MGLSTGTSLVLGLIQPRLWKEGRYVLSPGLVPSPVRGFVPETLLPSASCSTQLPLNAPATVILPINAYACPARSAKRMPRKIRYARPHACQGRPVRGLPTRAVLRTNKGLIGHLRTPSGADLAPVYCASVSTPAAGISPSSPESSTSIAEPGTKL